MRLMIAATFTAHFLGLATFMNSVPNDPTRLVILPRVEVHTGEGMARLSMVEPHVAAMLIPAASIDRKKSTWTTRAIASQENYLAGYEVVYLAGERVTFSTPGKKVVTHALPALPSLRSCCGTMGSGLLETYLPPYAGAAAIFEIPWGELAACKAAVGRTWRIDAKLTMPAGAALTITGITSDGVRRDIVLNATSDVTFYVVNAPSRWINGDRNDAPEPYDAPHSNAYYAMGDGLNIADGAVCRKLSECMNATELSPCNSSLDVERRKVPEVFKLGSPECSVATWP